jgi:hypothetical protein
VEEDGIFALEGMMTMDNFKCECTESGFCHKFNRPADPDFHKLCSGQSGLPRSLELAHMEHILNYKVNEAPPTQGERLANFSAALFDHILAGRPKVSDEEYARRLSICENCPGGYVDKSQESWICKAPGCGCRLQEGVILPGKARWADQECPKDYWRLALPMVNP